MTALNIRPITDLRNHYADVEGDIANGPVFLTKNGYGTSVLVSMDYFQRHFAMQDIYEHVARAEQEIDEGKGMNARDSISGRGRVSIAELIIAPLAEADLNGIESAVCGQPLHMRL